MSVTDDLRHGVRLLARAPVFAVVSLGSLGVALGVGLTLFTVMNGVLLRPVAGRGTHDVHALFTSDSDGDWYGGTSVADFRTFVDTPGLFEAACATTDVRSNIVFGGRSEGSTGAVVSTGCFEVFGIRPHIGRVLTRADDGHPSVVISHRFWRSAFGSDDAIVGRTALLGGASVVIIGVAEPGFFGVSLDGGEDFWASPPLIPTLLSPDALVARHARGFRVYARLAAGVSAEHATAQLNALAGQLRREDPRAWTDTTGATRRVTVMPEVQARFASSSGANQAIAAGTFGAIAFVVGLACVNLAILTMARGAGRVRELQVRLALGASRGRLLRQLATESSVISAGGVAMGLGVVVIALRLVEVLRPPELPAINLAIDGRVLAVSAALGLVTPMVFGLLPGAHAVRLAIAEGLKRGTESARRGWLRLNGRECLIVVQVAVAFAAMAMAALFVGALTRGAMTPIPTQGIAATAIDLNTIARTPAESAIVTSRVLESARRVPGVAAVTAAGVVPLTGSYLGFAVRDVDRPAAADRTVDGNIVAPGYFALASIATRAGRVFDEGDHATAPPVAIVSESLARELWGTTAVVGRRLSVSERLREVVGVVQDVPYRSLTAGTHPIIYLPLVQAARQRFVVHAHVGAGADTMAELDRVLRSVDARLIVGPTRPLSLVFDDVQIGARIVQWAGGVAGSWQLALTLMAVWGLVAHAVGRRTREIAIRRALGATEPQIVGLIMRPSVRLLFVGGLLGTALGAAVAGGLHAEFLGLPPFEFKALVPAVAVLGLVVVAAAWLPARRATAIAPAAALKHE